MPRSPSDSALRLASTPTCPGSTNSRAWPSTARTASSPAAAWSPGCCGCCFACAFSAPSKSDLQQADIVHVADRATVKAIADGIPDMPWIADAPVFLVFLRQQPPPPANRRVARQAVRQRSSRSLPERRGGRRARDDELHPRGGSRRARRVPDQPRAQSSARARPAARAARRGVPGCGPVRGLSRRARPHHAAPAAGGHGARGPLR